MTTRRSALQPDEEEWEDDNMNPLLAWIEDRIEDFRDEIREYQMWKRIKAMEAERDR